MKSTEERTGGYGVVDLAQLLLKTGQPPLSYKRPLPCTGTVSILSKQPPRVKPWSTFSVDASVWAGSVAPQLAGILLETGFSGWPWKRIEGPVLYGALKVNLLDMVEAVLDELGADVEFNHSTAEDGFTFCRTEDQAALLAIQVKESYALPGDSGVLEYDDLRALRPGKPEPEVTVPEQHIEQLYGYMVPMGKGSRRLYGAFCTEQAFWAAKLDLSTPEAASGSSDPPLLLSKPVLFGSLDPTAITALAYLCHLALQQQPSHPAASAALASRHPSGAPGIAGGNAGGWVASRVAELDKMSQPVALRVDELELGDLLGVGVTGRVYEGVYNGQRIAVKVPVRSGKREPGEVERELAHEAQLYLALRALQGTHVPALAAHGTLLNRAGSGRFPFVATQLVEGGVPLDEAVAGQLLPPQVLEAAAAHALAGLRAMHALGVAHGDVRGANCLATPDGRTMWVDLCRAQLGADAAAIERDVADAWGLVGGW
ncbi:Mitogen-activated protein kinase kinase kinase 10 [Tetrabaena socialis]|uniref:Mitogen-activated protein kinase kinase kinase 10 n=1 Tax=Tetrabaena socialis TaxID=47790 RepID=A0A2J8AES6_9CHLO|nr:Mitogen-activated protein kinase kinase kinase 10 [Tetrabaena socialis]|eukprot:PNH11020.1 Mitogen-activated protein kinase kinase kinase 10 [Tetrabaena socialis]